MAGIQPRSTLVDVSWAHTLVRFIPGKAFGRSSSSSRRDGRYVYLIMTETPSSNRVGGSLESTFNDKAVVVLMVITTYLKSLERALKYHCFFFIVQRRIPCTWLNRRNAFGPQPPYSQKQAEYAPPHHIEDRRHASPNASSTHQKPSSSKHRPGTLLPTPSVSFKRGTRWPPAWPAA